MNLRENPKLSNIRHESCNSCKSNKQNTYLLVYTWLLYTNNIQEDLKEESFQKVC